MCCSSYLREIARRAGTGIGATRRELGQLTDAGLLHRVRRGNQVYYQANRKNPIFAELKSILAKASGTRDILHEALTSVKDRIKLAFVYGSIERGEEKASSDVDLIVVGEISFSDWFLHWPRLRRSWVGRSTRRYTVRESLGRSWPPRITSCRRSPKKEAVRDWRRA